MNLGAHFVTWFEEKSYLNALRYFADLRSVLDAFFEKILVMDPNHPELRDNRLAMLKRLKDSFSRIADFSEIVTEGKTS